MKKCFLIFLFCVAPLFLSACSVDDSTKSDVAVVINGEEISREEFMVYLDESQNYFETNGGEDIWETDFGDGQTAEDAAKERALNSLKTIKITAERAASLGISLTDEEREQAKTEANTRYESYTEKEREAIGITEDQLVDIMEENILYTKVYSELTKNYEMSQSDFDAFYKANQDAYRRIARIVSLTTILVDDRETAEEVRQRARDGEDFDALFQKYETDPQELENGGKIEGYVGTIEDMFHITFDLNVGDISDVIEAPEGYYVFKVDAMEEGSEEEILAYAQAYYTAAMKEQIFNQEYEKWQESAVVEKNEAVWNDIHIIES